MNKLIPTMCVAAFLSGCAPTNNLMQPVFPATAPEKPANSEPEAPKRDSRASDRKPVSAKEINDRNAPQVLRDLDAELEGDIRDKSGKN